MTEKAKNAWSANALLAALLLGAWCWIARVDNAGARAESGGWDDDILVNSTEGAEDRFVLVDLRNKNIMVYKTEGLGQFRLVTARSYEADAEFPRDTSDSAEIEKKGITYLRALELWKTRKK